MWKDKRTEVIRDFIWIIFAVAIILLIPSEIKGARGSFWGGNSPVFFPYLSIALLMILNIFSLIKTYKVTLNTEHGKEKKDATKEKSSNILNYGRQIIIMTVTIVYAFLLPVLGYLISTILLLAIIAYIFCSGQKINWFFLLSYAVIFPFVLYFFFEKVMLVPLP